MALEHSRRREFTQFVSDHVLSNKYRNVSFAVVDTECQSDHVRRDRRASRPGFDRLWLSTAFRDPAHHFLNAEVDKWSFL